MTFKLIDPEYQLKKVTSDADEAIPDRAIPFILYCIRKTNFTPFFILVIFVSIIWSGSQLALSFAVGDLVALAENEDNLSWEAFYPVISFILILLAIRGGIGIFEWIGWIFGRNALEVSLKVHLNEYLHRHSYDYFINMPTGNLALKISEVPRNVIVFLNSICVEVMHILTGMILTIFFFGTLDMTLALGALAWSLLFIIGMIPMSLYTRTLSNRWARARAAVSGQIVDAVMNQLSVKLFTNMNQERRSLNPLFQEEMRTWYRQEAIKIPINLFRDGLSFVFIAAALWYLVDGILEGTFAIADLAFSVTLILMTMQRVNSLQYVISAMAEQIGIIDEGLALIVKPQKRCDATQKLSLSAGGGIKGDLSFGYNGSSMVFDNLKFDIKPREKVGLIGTSGAGKTTLINLLLRFYDVDKGWIKIDGQNIYDVTEESLRHHISVIPQDTTLFHRSLLENIRYGRLNATDEEVMEAAKKAHAHEFISKLTMGYDTPVGERGVRLSGGQRQRIAIARAILKDAPILILDEATSALDSESESLIQEALVESMQGKTVIAIAHRLSTIAHLDRLIVLEQGKIVEQGSHEELLDKKGLYARLWERQSGAFLK